MKIKRVVNWLGAVAALNALLPIGAMAAESPVYGGFSMNVVTQPPLTPFRDTTQDLDAMLVANGVGSYATINNNKDNLQAVTIPYQVNITGISSAQQIKGDTLGAQALATSMGLSDNKAINKQATIDFAVNTSTSSTSALLWGTAASSQTSTTNTEGVSLAGNTLSVTSNGLPAFNAASIMDPKNYSAEKMQQYLSVVTGTSVPMSLMLPTDFTGDDAVQNYNDYKLAVAREASVQSAAINVLQAFVKNNIPLTNTPAASLGPHFVNTGMIPTQNNIMQFMATRRLDPVNGWYARIQQASPIELQRESLYLQAEALKEADDIRQLEQKNSLMLALQLIENSRIAVCMTTLNTKMTTMQSTTSASGTTTETTTTEAVPMS